MKDKRIVVLLFFLSIYSCTFSQSGAVPISITPMYGDRIVNLADSSFIANDNSGITITNLKFYISKIQLLKNGIVILEENNSYHLVDASHIKTLQVLIDNKANASFDQLKFNLGIDSVTNVAGVMGGDLDPTKGMYWTWQSGYINFKLEGISPLCKTRNNEFQFHLGGYEKPNDCLQTKIFPTTTSGIINLKLDVKRILEQINLATTNQIMSPCAEAILLCGIVANSFTIVQK